MATVILTQDREDIGRAIIEALDHLPLERLVRGRSVVCRSQSRAIHRRGMGICTLTRRRVRSFQDVLPCHEFGRCHRNLHGNRLRQTPDIPARLISRRLCKLAEPFLAVGIPLLNRPCRSLLCFPNDLRGRLLCSLQFANHYSGHKNESRARLVRRGTHGRRRWYRICWRRFRRWHRHGLWWRQRLRLRMRWSWDRFHGVITTAPKATGAGTGGIGMPAPFSSALTRGRRAWGPSSPSSNASIILRLNAGRSAGLRDETMP